MEKLFWPVTVIGVCVVLLAVYTVFKAMIRKGDVPGRQDELENQLARTREKKVNDETDVSVDEQSAERAREVKAEETKAEGAAVSVVFEPEEAKSTSENWAFELWQRWCRQTGSWNMDNRLVIGIAGTLTPLQLETLLAVYRNDHPDLYRGVIFDSGWRKRCANPPAEFIGGRIEILKEAYSATIPANPKKLWNWWLEKTNKSKDADVLRHIMGFMSRDQIEAVKQQLAFHIPSCDRHCTQEAGLKNPDDFYRVQLRAVKAFLKAVK